MHTSLVPFSSSSFSLGPGPFTWKPESPGPQLFEYTSIMFLLKLKALACVTSVERWAEEKCEYLVKEMFEKYQLVYSSS